MPPKPRSGGTVEQVREDPPAVQEEQNGQQAAQATTLPTTGPTSPERKPPPLPTEKTVSSGSLSEKFVVIYGPEGGGKSTLASQWADGDVFFFNTAGELGEIPAYQQSITSWEGFREYAWAIAENPGRFRATAIDTGDTLGRYCAEKVRRKLGIAHESDLDWGKGWSTLRDEWQVNIAKLVAIPNMGVVIVAHSTEIEIKTRTMTWNKQTMRGVKGIREACLEMADLVLLIEFSEGDEEIRTIKTKPSRYHAAKERGLKPRLPAVIDWPLGTNGYDLLNDLWEKGAK